MAKENSAKKPTGKNNRSTTISDEKKSEKKQLAKRLRTSNKSSGTERYAAAAAATSRVAADEGVKKKGHIRAKPAPSVRRHQRNALTALTEAGEDDRFPLQQAHRFLTGFHINETLARVMTWGEGTMEQMEEEVGEPSEEEGEGHDDDDDDDEDEPFGFYKPKDDDNDEWEGDGGDWFGGGAGGDAMQGVEGGSVGFVASSMSVVGS